MRSPPGRTVAALLATVAVLLIATGCIPGAVDSGPEDGGDATGVLVFGAVPSKRPATLQQDHQPVIDMLEEETGQEIRFETASDYSELIRKLRDGRVDIAALGPLSYVLAKQQGAQITVVAARADEKDRPPEGYRAYGITWTGSSIKTLEDFRGRKVCFVDKSSTAGYLYPRIALLAAGIDPETDTTSDFAGGHDDVIIRVANRQCDAGFALDRIVDQQLIEEGRLQPGQITTVWKSDVIPAPPIVIANHLSTKLRQQLTTALQNKANADYLRAHDFCQGPCTIADGAAYGYQKVDDTYYDDIRKICTATRSRSCT